MKPNTLSAYSLDEIILSDYDDFFDAIIYGCMQIDVGGAEYVLINLKNIINALNAAVKEEQDDFNPEVCLDEITSFIKENELESTDLLVFVQ